MRGPSTRGWTSAGRCWDASPRKDEIVPRTRAYGVDFEIAYISEDAEDSQTHATYNPDDETVYLNAFADDWNEPSPRRIGTVRFRGP